MLHCSFVQVLRKGIKIGIKISEGHPLGCAAQVTGAVHMDTACGSPGKALNCHQHQLSSGTVYVQQEGKENTLDQQLPRALVLLRQGRSCGGRVAASPGWKSTSCQDIQAPE